MVDSEAARDFFTFEEPLGPASVKHQIHDDDALQIIYDRTVRPYEDEEPEDATYIFGRRGSGKTTLLVATSDFGRRPSVQLYDNDLLAGMRDAITAIEEELHYTLTLESRVRLWSRAFYIAAGTYLASEPEQASHMPDRIRLRECVHDLMQGRGSGAHDPTEVIRTFIDLVLDSARVRLQGVFSTWLDNLEFGETSVRQVVSIVDRILKEEERQLVILVDSLEELTRRPEYYQEALRPLFALLGEQASRGSRANGLRVRCCLPTELGEKLEVLSENPSKDFVGVCYIRWRTSDLMQLVTSRLSTFASLRATDGQPALSTRLQSLTGSPKQILEQLLPEEVTNLCGQTEQTLPYVLRHTQLLPRQLLKLLNHLFRGEARIERISDGGRIGGQEVLDSVYWAEAELCKEVINAHRATHLEARVVLDELIPNLPSRFTDDDLHALYDDLGLREHSAQFDRLRSLLVQLGVVGAVERETDFYVRGLFAYTFPNGFSPARTDELCLHPMFSRHKGRRPQAVKPIYPAAGELADEPVYW